MRPKLNIPTYTSKDIPILFATMLPMAILLNYFLFGTGYFSHPPLFLWATLVTFIYMGLSFLTYGLVAVSLRYRFPSEGQLIKRLTICISIFFLMSAVYMSVLLLLYDFFHFMGYIYNDQDFLATYFTLIVVNVFLTFLNEGIYRFEKYRATITETEQLKKEFMQSRLLGLKSQMNPHFLFNSLNTLSSLIAEDEDRAEDFLNHMSKVYRYQLKYNEETLALVSAELDYIHSYYHLLKARHDQALSIVTKVPEELGSRLVPPMTLQMLLEFIIQHNSVEKTHPLQILVSAEGDWLTIAHEVRPKLNSLEPGREVMENIANKYRLLCQQEPEIFETQHQRMIRLPLISEPEKIGS